RAAPPEGSREAEDRAGGPRRQGPARAQRGRGERPGLRREPRRRLEGRQGLDRHAQGLHRQAEGDRPRRAQPQRDGRRRGARRGRPEPARRPHLLPGRPGHGYRPVPVAGRQGREGNAGAHQRLARGQADPGAGRHRAAVREREVGARGPGLRRLARRHPVGPRAGRRRQLRPAARKPGVQGDEDHAVRLEGAGDDAGARRHDADAVRRRVDPARLELLGRRRLRAGDGPEPGRHRALAGPAGGDGREGRRGRDDPRRPAPAAGARHDDDHDDSVTRRIAVILGGRSSENAISRASATSVVAALEAAGDDVLAVEIDREGRWQLGAGGPKRLVAGERLPGQEIATKLSGVDVVFPVLHGPFGEDGTVQGLLELAGVPYVGAGVLASALCMDKDVFKSVLRDQGIPVTENITLRLGAEPRNPFGYPVFVKPARLGSSVGITKAHDDDELEAAVALAFEHDEKVLVERFVSGIEVEVGVLGNLTPTASLPGEIVVTHNEWYDFEAKYDEGEMDLVVPARIGEEQIARAQELAVRAFVATDCEGMARADMFVRDDGEVLVNELNTIPGFTPTSVYARLFEASGIPYAELLQRLADLAVERFERKRGLRYSVAFTPLICTVRSLGGSLVMQRRYWRCLPSPERRNVVRSRTVCGAATASGKSEVLSPALISAVNPGVPVEMPSWCSCT